MKSLSAALAAVFLAFGSAASAECNWIAQETETPHTVVKLPAGPEDDGRS